MAILTCLIFTAREWTGERSDATFVWAQLSESDRAWYFPVPLTNEPEEDIDNLPSSVTRRFQRLPAAHYRSDDVFAFRLRTGYVDEEELDRDWIAAASLAVVFREPKDECDYSIEGRNMTSSSEAFSKFSMWKNLKSPLRVTVIVNGKTTELLLVRVYAIDDELSIVGTVGSAMHSFSDFDVEDSVFSVEPKRVVATRNESDWIVFEELSD
jgi:hypothetical protein